MSQRTRRLIREQCQELENQLPWYFDGIDLHFEDMHVSDPLFAGHSCLPFVTGLMNYIMQHPVAFEERRRELTDAARVALEGVEAVAFFEPSGPDGLVELASQMHLHWELRDQLSAMKLKDELEPEPNVLYLEEDFMDP